MTRSAPSSFVRLLLALLVLATAASAALAGPADTLRAKHAELAPLLAASPFQRPLHLESRQDSGELQGEVHAVVEHPFAVVTSALQGAEPWCDIFILHLNVKQCRAEGGPPAHTLAVSVGRKHDQPVADAHRIDFAYRQPVWAPDYLKAVLNAAEGPMGTHDYRIVVEAVPLDAKRSFVHMSYSYGYGFAARMAMQGYLSTIGSGKVGFSVVERGSNGQPVYVGNVRGVIERNTMRYYLAIDSYLASMAVPPEQRQEKRLRDWFAATERYARQLHEIEQADYLAMKRREIARQQAAVTTARTSR